MNDETEKLSRLIKNARRTVFFGGAGVSTESGIPDFRSVDGLYSLRSIPLTPDRPWPGPGSGGCGRRSHPG